MKEILFRAVVMLCAFSMIALTQAKSAGQRLPLEEFYQGPALESPRLSPDGTHLLALSNVGEMTVVVVINLQTGAAFYPIKTNNKEYRFNWVEWAKNDRILASMRFDSVRNGIVFTETRLFAMDAKKPSEPINLLKQALKGNNWISQYQDNVISYMPEDPRHILVSADLEFPGNQSVYKINVYNGQLARVKKYQASTYSWMADRNGNVRIAVGYDDQARKVTIRVLKNEKWKTAWEYVVFDEPSIEVAGFGGHPDELYLFADYQGRQALYKVDLGKEGFPKQLILSSSEYDIKGRLIYSHNHKDVVGIYYNDGYDKSIFWSDEFKAFQAGLDKALPETSNFIVSLSDDARKYLLISQNSTNPGAYYFGNRDTRQLVVAGAMYPSLTPDKLPVKQKKIYKARDGLLLEGYLSLPKNIPAEPVATIILPHGGPMSEDDAGFDMFSTFFTSRGYAVFQPNFRGSSGRGHDFMAMAVGGMGLAMQDDLEDAVTYLVKEKIADPDKLCIVGASYGGYAALMGAVKTPDLFKCAVSFAGISDIAKLREKSRYYLNRNVVRKQLSGSRDQLKNTSPALLAERVKIPVLLIHGDKDTVVPVDQSRLMAEALQDAGKNYEYVELEGGSHFLDYFPHRKKTFEAIDRFIGNNLPL